MTISKGTIPQAQYVAPATLQRMSGDPYCVAYTLPEIAIDMQPMYFPDRKQSGGGKEVGYASGKMKVDLKQAVYVANNLTQCAQSKWAAHERHHVDDNRACMDQLEAAALKLPTCDAFFVQQHWFPATQWAVIKQELLTEIGTAFRELTSAHVNALDSDKEYNRVFRAILRDCPAPITHVVIPGETYSSLALRYYGAASKANVIHKKNIATAGPNPNYLRSGTTIIIPKR